MLQITNMAESSGTGSLGVNRPLV